MCSKLIWQPVPIGVVGELYVGGIGVGRGYLNDPEQTRRRFLRNPFSKDRKGRLYRTGDLARWRGDGLLECLGRVDHQVKMRGYRIEPGEIEHILLEHADVRAVTVLVRHESGGEARLVAYVVAAPERQPTANELRDFLRRRVPIYMIPQGFVFLSHLPLTAHGKLDRSALAEMRQGLSMAGTEFVAPRTPTETILSRIWTDLLKIDNVGALSNFFDLGGHSLLAGQVLARVARECGVALPIQALFEAPTLEALARRIEDAGDVQWDEPMFEIARPAGDRPQPVSILQERVLRIERELPGLPQFNLPFAYRLQGPLNVEALERSLAEMMRRHDLLRTGFAWADERPFALTVPASKVDFTLTVEDLAAEALPQKERATSAVAQAGSAASRATSLDTLRLGACTAIPDAPLPARPARPRLAAHSASYHRRWLVDRSFVRRGLKALFCICCRPTSAFAAARTQLFRFRALATPLVHEPCRDPAAGLLEG